MGIHLELDLTSLKLGVRLISPIIPSIIIFGLIFGFTGGNADLPLLLVSSTSFIIFAGTAQFFVILAIIQNDPIVTIIITAIIINIRHLLYGAALHHDIKAKGLKKILVSYLLTDEVFIVASEIKKKIHGNELDENSVKFEDMLIGAGFFAWSVWNVCTIVGYLFSGLLVGVFTFSSDFIVSGTFLGYLVIQWKDYPTDRLFILEIIVVGFILSFWFRSSTLLIGILLTGAFLAMVEQYRENQRISEGVT
jgi:predicted branched-subunit amino acid permease